MPGPGTVLQEGDVLHVLAQKDDLDRIASSVRQAGPRRGKGSH